MKDISAEAGSARYGRSEQPGGAATGQASRHVHFALLAIAVFGIYWCSSFVIEAAHRTTHFAADTWFYTELAKGNVFGRLADNYHLDRIFRFHPATVVLAVGWMQLAEPLTPWITPIHQLKALFALVGAVGVWAAMWAFAAVVPRRYAVLFGVIYASSLNIWYFSSIEESKIVSATLTTLYIATYLHLRETWTLRGAALLTAILLVACLNEIVAGFLVIIPIVDTLVRRGWDLRYGRWIAVHALAGPAALAILEIIMRARTGAAGAHPEGANHLSTLIYYISQNDYSLGSIYAFATRWLFFSVAAPSPDASLWANVAIGYGGDIGVTLTNYFASPISAGLVVVFGVMLAASILPRYRGEAPGLAGILPGLLAFALLRGIFFLIFVPKESVLFSASAALAHLLMIGIPFAVSSFPAKRGLLAAAALLLFINNGTFIIGR